MQIDVHQIKGPRRPAVRGNTSVASGVGQNHHRPEGDDFSAAGRLVDRRPYSSGGRARLGENDGDQIACPGIGDGVSPHPIYA